MNYKKIIEKHKNARNWTTHHMAIEAEINPATVLNWINRNTVPSLDAIERLCGAFGITMSEFFNEDNDISFLTDEQKLLLNEWNGLHKNEKEYLLKFISALNANRLKNPF